VKASHIRFRSDKRNTAKMTSLGMNFRLSYDKQETVLKLGILSIAAIAGSCFTLLLHEHLFYFSQLVIDILTHLKNTIRLDDIAVL
jgi:hypothetical protein